MKMKTTVLLYLSQWRISGRVLLCFCWILGVLLGFSSALMAKDILFSMMPGFVFGSVSIVGILAVSVVPLLLSAIVVYLSEYWMIYFLCLTKAFCFSFCATGISLSFGCAAWLITSLLMFSDLLTIPILFLYSCLSVQSFTGKRLVLFGCCFAACCCIGIVDYCFIVPFLNTVLS